MCSGTLQIRANEWFDSWEETRACQWGALGFKAPSAERLVCGTELSNRLTALLLCRKRPPLSITHGRAWAIPRRSFNQRNRSHQQACRQDGGCSNLSWLSHKATSDASSADEVPLWKAEGGSAGSQAVMVGSSSSTLGSCDHSSGSVRYQQTNLIWFLDFSSLQDQVLTFIYLWPGPQLKRVTWGHWG